MGIRTYDPGRVIVSFLGINITGYAKGTFIKAERNEDTYSLMVGAGGETARSRSRNRSGKVTITLMSSSPTNDYLSAAAAADEVAGTGVGPLQIKDLNGTSLVHGANGWIVKPAPLEEGEEITNREWVIEVDELDMLVGSNLLSA
jgi:hypothetical protein